jgi:hypothetical protein
MKRLSNTSQLFPDQKWKHYWKVSALAYVYQVLKPAGVLVKDQVNLLFHKLCKFAVLQAL